MEPLFAEARFRHPWRAYQQRVLDDLARHLDDRRLHVVAPPGSGKTVLGLEVVCRIGRPALILAPTLTVREQWVTRFDTDFMGGTLPDGAVSREMLAPAVLTVSTYQSLASVFKADDSARLTDALREAGVQTLVVDEAHHLRSYWWSCLQQVEASLDGLHVIALTATPPVDVPQAEWNRYAGFCGPVDEEIAAPELVRSGDLCPHQDYVYLALPTARDAETLAGFSRRVRGFLSALGIDMELAEMLAGNARLLDPEAHIDEILAHGELYLAIAVYLDKLRWEAPRKLLEVMGLDEVALPPFDLDWAEVLLNGVLFDESWHDDGGRAHLRGLLATLRAIGAVERRQILLRSSPGNDRLLRASPSKVESVCRIVELESARRRDLRLVVLTDHVRANLFPATTDTEPVIKVGVVPIFDALRRRRLRGVIPCVLTGTLVVLPVEVARRLVEGDDALRAARLHPLVHAPDFARIELRAGARQLAVARVTELFDRGLVNVIVGTAALLGEGWDAPAVDTIVLATTVASYVTSNQLRGRAIRSRHDDPYKCANIWHLACVEVSAVSARESPPARGDRVARGDDLQTLRRRFETFAGLALATPRIESGLARLGIDRRPLANGDVARLNALMARHAGDRDALPERWREALAPRDNREPRLVRELRAPSQAIAPHLRLLRRPRGRVLSLLGAWLARWHLSRLSRAVVDALVADGLIAPADHRLVLSSDGSALLRCSVTLDGAGYLDQSRFVASLAQLFDRLAAPRYLLLRKKCYYAVPSWFGERRERAGRFAHAFRRRVGRAELIYTRNLAGKRHLLRAMERALLERFDERVETRTEWR